MSVLTVIYGGQTIHNAGVEAFSFEASADGNLFIAASTQPTEPGEHGVPGLTGETLDELVDDDRLTPFERSILEKRRQADGTT